MTQPASVNSDGRYYWAGNFDGVVGDQLLFVGGSEFLTGTLSMTWSILQAATDGSAPVISYSTDGGSTVVSAQVGLEGTQQSQVNASGQILVDLTSATGIQISVTSTGGAHIDGADQWVIAVALNRNANETLPWNSPSPYNPINYNPDRMDFSGYPAQTLAELRQRVLIELGFANQASNPPPGMAAFVNEKLIQAHNFLYRRYPALHTKRFFRWKVAPGQRFYSLKDNDDDALSTFHLDPQKAIEWVGIQDTRNVWYPLIQGIPPQLYTMIDKPWRPARYDIRQCIEIYPAPDQTYWLWVRGHFGLLPFTADSDQPTIDSELVFLHATGTAKKHYGQPDGNDFLEQAKIYLGQLIASTHQTAHYIPATTPVPPAVRPTLIHYADNSGAL